jgi:hypothetical protein
MIHNIADITPGGSAVALKAARTPCNWVQVLCPTGNAAAMRLGDSTTGAASGLSLPAGTGMLFPPIGDTQYLDLALIYIYGTNTDKISVVYGTH